jgi:hypothetical protein
MQDRVWREGRMRLAGITRHMSSCISSRERGRRDTRSAKPMLGADRLRAKIELRSDRVLAYLCGAQHAVEKQVEVMGHLLGALARPDVQRLGGTLRLLKRCAFR